MFGFKSLAAAVVVAAAPVLAIAAPAAAAEITRTQAYQFADGLGAGQNVARAEDGVALRNVSNLRILVQEFKGNYGGVKVPATVTGVADGNRDGLDDDGRVNVALFGSYACLKLGTGSYSVANGRCAAVAAAAVAPAAASARGVEAATRWHVATENYWAAQSAGARVGARNVAAVRNAFSELRAGVTVKGLSDANRDGNDDDGRITFASSAGSFCLTLPTRAGVVGTVVKGGC